MGVASPGNNDPRLTWDNGLEAPICRYMVGWSQNGWPTA